MIDSQECCYNWTFALPTLFNPSVETDVSLVRKRLIDLSCSRTTASYSSKELTVSSMYENENQPTKPGGDMSGTYDWAMARWPKTDLSERYSNRKWAPWACWTPVFKCKKRSCALTIHIHGSWKTLPGQPNWQVLGNVYTDGALCSTKTRFQKYLLGVCSDKGANTSEQKQLSELQVTQMAYSPKSTRQTQAKISHVKKRLKWPALWNSFITENVQRLSRTHYLL